MQMTISEASQLPSVSLAFMGDAVHSADVRRRLISRHDFKSGALTRLSSRYVCAKAQAAMMTALLPCLSEEEADVARRARNTRTNNKPKNAAWEQYRLATALEAVLGFLFLTGNEERLTEILGFIFKEEFIR